MFLCQSVLAYEDLEFLQGRVKKTVAGPQMAFTRKHREFVSFGFVSAACQKTDKHSSTCHVCLRSDRSSNDAGAVQMRMMQP